MTSLPVFTRIPEVPRWPGDKCSAEQWAFRCLMFYASPLHHTPAGRGNHWQIRFSQVHIKQGDWRFLSIVPHINPRGETTGISITETNAMPVESVAEMKFWTTPFFECDVGSVEAERVEYTHRDLMRHLRDGRTQERLLVGAADPHQFWRNLVGFLIDLRIIGPNSMQTFNANLATSFNPYNVPVSEARARAKSYRAAQLYRQR